jgi:hypothetical protein
MSDCYEILTEYETKPMESSKKNFKTIKGLNWKLYLLEYNHALEKISQKTVSNVLEW